MSSAPDQVDRATLRLLARKLAAEPTIASVRTFPPGHEPKVVVLLDSAMYPELITTVELQLELRTNGDFYIHYRENRSGEYRECRWDRHENDHNSRDHYHPFPAARRAEAEDRDFPADAFQLLETVVLPAIEQRWVAVCGELGD